jgi:hypothetical protein
MLGRDQLARFMQQVKKCVIHRHDSFFSTYRVQRAKRTPSFQTGVVMYC